MASVVALVGIAARVMCVSLLGVAVAGAQAQQPQEAFAIASKPAAQSAPAARSYSHYIEFRAAQIAAYGHAYVAYGRLNARGQPAEFNYADRHPVGSYLHMAVGHLLPVPANTRWDPDVLKLPIVSAFRRNLTAAEYQKLLAAIRRAQADTKHWNALSNNCNHFVAELAQALGMKVPAGLQVSYAFIPSLRELNQGPQYSQAAVTTKPVSPDRAPVQ